jgi:dipeptidyl aminopeptidase/acylaminoacyl peptidase
MIKWFFGGGFVALAVLAAALFFFPSQTGEIVSPLAPVRSKPSPLLVNNKYALLTFESLAKRELKKGEIKLGTATRFEKNYTTYVFTYKSEGKTVSGMANIPKGQGSFPVIVLLRGHVDREFYYIGHGTEKQANYYADNGFLTLSPDFLGYGYSDNEDQDILIARFTRPVTVLNLLASISSLSQADPARIGLWGHSNGGQIALSILEITGKPYPTSLWAPVSLGFPESVLVYLGEPEVGNIVKDKIDEFSLENDPKKYSIVEYLDQITASVIVHQGGRDELIKTKWTLDLVDKLKKQGLAVKYYYYPQENHNFNGNKSSADILRKRDVEFFRKQLTD